MANPIVSQDRLRELFSYDPETGDFTRIVRTSNNATVGMIAGCRRKDGYNIIRIDGRLYLGHRLAWLYVHDRWPVHHLDHIDCDRSNNRLKNLREASDAQNRQNIRKERKDNRSGLLGVYLHTQLQRWTAQISVNNKSYHLGMFDTKELAHAAYLTAKRKLHEFSTL